MKPPPKLPDFRRAPKMGEVSATPTLPVLRQIAQGAATHSIAGRSRSVSGGFPLRQEAHSPPRISDFSSEGRADLHNVPRLDRLRVTANLQGIGALEMLNLMEQFDLGKFGLNRRAPSTFRSKPKLATRVLRYIGDPKKSKCPSQHALERMPPTAPS